MFARDNAGSPRRRRPHPAGRACRVAGMAAAGSGLTMSGLFAILGAPGASTSATTTVVARATAPTVPTTMILPAPPPTERDDEGAGSYARVAVTVAPAAPPVPARPAPVAQTVTQRS